jgi:6-carboxyhexanoate--CoA ligase
VSDALLTAPPPGGIDDVAGALYSVRMRAAAGGAHEDGGRHVSGAERLVPENEVETVALELMARARNRADAPDFVQVTVERISAGDVARTPPLPITTILSVDAGAARGRAVRILRETGIGFDAIARAFDGLRSGMGSHGAAPRGAALFDRVTGERLDQDPARGVRASRFDYTPETRRQLTATLGKSGLTHFRVTEALAVATKALWSGIRAEICWSDDPDYVAGYIATPNHGYVRFPRFKPDGAVGGRVFFVEQDTDLSILIDRLERRALLIDGGTAVREEEG